MDQTPWDSVSGGFRVTGVVTANAFIHILARAHIAPASFFTPEDINVEHGRRFGGGFRAAGIRTRDLLNPIQAHYQAVLRPDLSDYSLRAEPLPNDFGKVPSVAQVLRKASINCGSSSL